MAHLLASEWDVIPVPQFEARRLVAQFHYAKTLAVNLSYCHGLRKRQPWAQIDGAACWSQPMKPSAVAVAGERWAGVLNLTRLVVHPGVPTNGASFLLGRSMRMIDRERWPVLVTYADEAQGHTGAIYRATNWRYDGSTIGGDGWIAPGGGRRTRRRGAYRNLSSDELRAMGYTRVRSVKHRFVHSIRS